MALTARAVWSLVVTGERPLVAVVVDVIVIVHHDCSPQSSPQRRGAEAP